MAWAPCSCGTYGQGLTRQWPASIGEMSLAGLLQSHPEERFTCLSLPFSLSIDYGPDGTLITPAVG